MQKDVELDPNALARLHRLGGIQLVHKILDLFLNHAPLQISNALAAQRENDPKGVEQAVHALKSSAGNVGAQKLLNLAESIERLVAENNYQSIAPLVLELQLAWDRLEPLIQQEKRGLES